MKWLEKITDLLVWALILTSICAFIFNIATLPLWASAISGFLLVAVLMYWD